MHFPLQLLAALFYELLWLRLLHSWAVPAKRFHFAIIWQIGQIWRIEQNWFIGKMAADNNVMLKVIQLFFVNPSYYKCVSIDTFQSRNFGVFMAGEAQVES